MEDFNNSRKERDMDTLLVKQQIDRCRRGAGAAAGYLPLRRVDRVVSMF